MTEKSEFIDSITNKVSSLLSTINLKIIFVSMLTAKSLDTFTAWIAFKCNPDIFALREMNDLIREAFVKGEILPFLWSQMLIYSLFALTALSLWWFANKRRDRTKTILSIPALTLGFIPLWLYPVTISTNIINGIILLNLTWPISRLVYALMGFPVACFFIIISLNSTNRRFLEISFLAVILISIYL